MSLETAVKQTAHGSGRGRLASAHLKLKVTSTELGGKAVMRLEAPPTLYGEECA